MDTKRWNIYVACGLTHVPRDVFSNYVTFLHGLASGLSTALPVQVRYALRDSDPQLAEKPFVDRARLCYLWDKEMVESADVIVAEASYPSTGLGIELQIACARETPIILLFRKAEDLRANPIQYQTPDAVTHDLQLGDGYVSLMALGMPSVFRVLPYTDYTNARRLVEDAVATLLKPQAVVAPPDKASGATL